MVIWDRDNPTVSKGKKLPHSLTGLAAKVILSDKIVFHYLNIKMWQVTLNRIHLEYLFLALLIWQLFNYSFIKLLFIISPESSLMVFLFLLRWPTPDCTVCCPWCPDSGWCSLCGRTFFRWSGPQLWLSPEVTVGLCFSKFYHYHAFGHSDH